MQTSKEHHMMCTSTRLKNSIMNTRRNHGSFNKLLIAQVETDHDLRKQAYKVYGERGFYGLLPAAVSEPSFA